MSLSRTTVLVADDHPLYREAVARAVGARPDLELVGVAEDGDEALAIIRDHQPAVAVLDVRMPALGGVAVLEAIARAGLTTRVVLLSADVDGETVYTAVAGGVGAYLSKVDQRRPDLRRRRGGRARGGRAARRGPGRPRRADPGAQPPRGARC